MKKIGIVGLGYWGPNLLRNFSAVEDCEVAYGCDLNEQLLEKFRPQYPGTTFTTDYNELMNDDSLDAVAIATPVFAHYPLAKQALEHGKHVLVEKPMASTVAECEELIALAKEKGVQILVDHTFLYTGAVKKIKELVESGELGEMHYFDSERINLGLLQSDVNVIWDLAPHDLSIMNYVFAGMKPVSVFAEGSGHVQNKLEEMAHLTVNYDTGVAAHIHVSWLSPIKMRKTLIAGDKKMILYDDIEVTEKVKVYDKGVDLDLSEETSSSPIYRSGDIFVPKLDEKEALFEEAQHFIAVISGKEEPLVNGEAGLEVVRILEASNQSLEEGRKIEL